MTQRVFNWAIWLVIGLTLLIMLSDRIAVVQKGLDLFEALGMSRVKGLQGPFRLVRVSDGDTIVVKIGAREEKLRLIGIDTPEKFESEKLEQDTAASPLSKEEIKRLGEAASAYTEKLLAGKKVYLELDATERDRYGRLLAYVYWRDTKGDWRFADKTFSQLNLEIVEAGWAEPLTIPPNVRYAETYLKASQQARQTAKGMWAVLP
jgi:micrococcal nuclease